MNLYGYANGDPVNFSDPYGLSAVANPCLIAPHLCIAAAAGAAKGVSAAAKSPQVQAAAAATTVFVATQAEELGNTMASAMDGFRGRFGRWLKAGLLAGGLGISVGEAEGVGPSTLGETGDGRRPSIEETADDERNRRRRPRTEDPQDKKPN